MESYEAVSLILKSMAEAVSPGVKTKEIDAIAEKKIKELGVTSYNKGYKPSWSNSPYPAVSCICVNSVIAHGIPDNYVLKEGDIVSLDLGVTDKNGNCGDAALTVPVGKVDNRKARLLYYAHKTLYEAISKIKAGVSTKVIAETIQTFSDRRGYKVNRRFGGHTIGKEMHMEPKIFNTVEEDHKWSILKEDQIICIEPMLTPGRDNMGITQPDGWAFVTSDNQPSAFFEHMIKVTKNGYEILTNHISDVVSYY